jgi:hypothetical protein
MQVPFKKKFFAPESRHIHGKEMFAGGLKSTQSHPAGQCQTNLTASP